MPLPKSPKEDISIHAPREGSDFQVRGDFVDGLGISIHAPREGSDFMPWTSKTVAFISIHAPREGSDMRSFVRNLKKRKFQSTLPVRGATSGLQDVKSSLIISIHAPREGSDLFAPSPGRYLEISIHAPREGSDGRVKSQCNTNRNFNPRSP